MTISVIKLLTVVGVTRIPQTMNIVIEYIIKGCTDTAAFQKCVTQLTEVTLGSQEQDDQLELKGKISEKDR